MNTVIDIDRVIGMFREHKVPKREAISIMCGAIGLQAEETADEMCIAPSTVRKQQEKGKEKLGKSKMVELAGLVICEALGVNYDSVVEQIKDAVRNELSKRVLSLIILVSFGYGVSQQQGAERLFRSRNQNRIELITRYRREA